MLLQKKQKTEARNITSPPPPLFSSSFFIPFINSTPSPRKTPTYESHPPNLSHPPPLSHHALAMEAIAHNKPFCFVRLVIKKIAAMYDSSAHNDTIKYGVLLTKLCLRVGVCEQANDARKMQRMAMNKSTLIRAAGQLRNRLSSSTTPPG